MHWWIQLRTHEPWHDMSEMDKELWHIFEMGKAQIFYLSWFIYLLTWFMFYINVCRFGWSRVGNFFFPQWIDFSLKRLLSSKLLKSLQSLFLKGYTFKLSNEYFNKKAKPLWLICMTDPNNTGKCDFYDLAHSDWSVKWARVQVSIKGWLLCQCVCIFTHLSTPCNPWPLQRG